MSLEQKFAPEQISLYTINLRERGPLQSTFLGFERFFHSITLAETREINASVSTLMSIVESFHHQLLPKTMKNGRLPGNQKTSRSHWKKHIIFQSNFSQLFPLTHTHEKMLNSALFFLYPHCTQITFNEILSCVNMSVKITNVWLRRQEKKNFDK